jgi:hypothetical protein
MKVRVNSIYTYRPVGWDIVSPALQHLVQPGTRVRVVNMRGCPPANTMGHCYIETLEGDFIGLVLTASLVKE